MKKIELFKKSVNTHNDVYGVTFHATEDNEVVATELHRRLLEPGEYVPYRLLHSDRRVYSACDQMLGPDEELVSAYDLIRKRKQDNRESDLMFYVRCCEELGIESVMDGLAKMFACDYILANRDRHWRNFGVIRNVETLEGVGLAPVFDTGSCLWSDRIELELPIDFKYKAKPFKYDGMRPYDQIQLFAGHYGWFDEGALEGFVDSLKDILSANPNISEARIESIAGQVDKNIEQLVMTTHA